MTKCSESSVSDTSLPHSIQAIGDMCMLQAMSLGGLSCEEMTDVLF